MTRRMIALCCCFLLHVSGAVAQSTDGAISDPAPPPPAFYIVLFDSENAEITEAAQLVLHQVVQDYAVYSQAILMVTGRYDRSNTEEYANEMSRRMAENVRAYLVANGVPAGSIKLDWRGERDPLVSTPDGVAEAANRSVTISFDLSQH